MWLAAFAVELGRFIFAAAAVVGPVLAPVLISLLDDFVGHVGRAISIGNENTPRRCQTGIHGF